MTSRRMLSLTDGMSGCLRRQASTACHHRSGATSRVDLFSEVGSMRAAMGSTVASMGFTYNLNTVYIVFSRNAIAF